MHLKALKCLVFAVVFLASALVTAKVLEEKVGYATKSESIRQDMTEVMSNRLEADMLRYKGCDLLAEYRRLR